MIDTRTYLFTARGKSKKSLDSKRRSSMLKYIMGEYSGDAGKALADAIEAKNLDRCKELLNKATSDIISRLEKEFKEGKDE